MPHHGYPLDDDQVGQLAELAQSNAFFRSVYANYQRYGTVTKKQYLAFIREFDPTYFIGDVRVVNLLLRNGRLMCFRCREFATTAVGKVGVCEDHVDDQRRANSTYDRDHALIGIVPQQRQTVP